MSDVSNGGKENIILALLLTDSTGELIYDFFDFLFSVQMKGKHQNTLIKSLELLVKKVEAVCNAKPKALSLIIKATDDIVDAYPHKEFIIYLVTLGESIRNSFNDNTQMRVLLKNSIISCLPKAQLN